MGSAIAKHYIHEIGALVSLDLDRAECVALKKNTKNSYIVVRKSLVYEASCVA